MALRPRGVAAFPIPRRLAVIFIEIAVIAGEFLGSLGKSLWVKGRRAVSKKDVSPDFSAILVSPVQKHIIPRRPIMVVIASFAPSKDAAVTSETFPRIADTTKEIITIKPQI